MQRHMQHRPEPRPSSAHPVTSIEAREVEHPQEVDDHDGAADFAEGRRVFCAEAIDDSIEGRY